MLDNVLTLAVDVLNNGTTGNQVYSRYSEYQNRSVYIGNGHSVAAKNTLSFYRAFPTKTGNFLGTAKSSFKVTEDIQVPGVDAATTLTVPVIAEVSFSFPVGTTAAKQLEIRQRLLALLDNDSLMVALNNQLMV